MMQEQCAVTIERNLHVAERKRHAFDGAACAGAVEPQSHSRLARRDTKRLQSKRRHNLAGAEFHERHAAHDFIGTGDDADAAETCGDIFENRNIENGSGELGNARRRIAADDRKICLGVNGSWRWRCDQAEPQRHAALADRGGEGPVVVGKTASSALQLVLRRHGQLRDRVRRRCPIGFREDHIESQRCGAEFP